MSSRPRSEKLPLVPASAIRQSRYIERKNVSRNSIRFLMLSDWRVQSIPRLLGFIDGLAISPDLILYAGDDTRRFDGFEQLVTRAKIGIAGVIGNDCLASDRILFHGPKRWNLHESPLVVGDIGLMGIEGATSPPGIVLHSESYVKEHLKRQVDMVLKAGAERIGIVSHQPPFGILDVSMRFGVSQIGSKALRDFLKKYNPLISFIHCGHSHLSGGMSMNQGNTVILNTACHDDYGSPGNVAIGRMVNGEFTHEWHQIDAGINHHSDLAILFDVGYKRITAMNKLGLTTLSDISDKNRMKLKSLPGVGEWHVKRWIEQAKAIRSGKIVIKDSADRQQLVANPITCYDIETNLECNHVWLIGALEIDSGRFVQFFEKDNEEKLLCDFSKFISNYPRNLLVSYSACKFERRVMTEVALRHNNTKLLENVDKEIDWGYKARLHLFGNIPSFRVKELGSLLGYRFRHPDIDGLTVGRQYTVYRISKEEPDWRTLLEYNEDDVRATVTILKAIRKGTSIPVERRIRKTVLFPDKQSYMDRSSSLRHERFNSDFDFI